MLDAHRPALVLAPMDGITDAPMRAFMGLSGAFSYAVTEFIRVSASPLPPKVFRRDIPELQNGGQTPSGMSVQIQILGGDPDRMAISALNATKAGATSIDINFGCPAPTVNRNDGGASLLRSPCRIREVVRAVRDAVPKEFPVSAKLRLGWEDITDIHENAQMAAEGGASWLTIHARTRVQGYQPPVYWPEIRKVRGVVPIPVIANGDIWTIDDFHQCQEETGCIHYMIGRSALSNPQLPAQIASELGIASSGSGLPIGWEPLLRAFMEHCLTFPATSEIKTLLRLKQWANLANKFGDFPNFESAKLAKSTAEFFEAISNSETVVSASA